MGMIANVSDNRWMEVTRSSIVGDKRTMANKQRVIREKMTGGYGAYGHLGVGKQKRKTQRSLIYGLVTVVFSIRLSAGG